MNSKFNFNASQITCAHEELVLNKIMKGLETCIDM